MGDLVLFRRDTIDNWQSVNPILADGKVQTTIILMPIEQLLLMD